MNLNQQSSKSRVNVNHDVPYNTTVTVPLLFMCAAYLRSKIVCVTHVIFNEI